MANVVKGNSMVLYAEISGSYKPVACAKSCSITTTSEVIDLASYSSSTWTQSIYGRLSGNISGTGLTLLSDASNYTNFDLFNLQFARTQFNVKVILTDTNSSTKVIESPVIIEEISVSGETNGIVNYSFSFKMSGVPTTSGTAVSNPTTSYKYTYTATTTVSTVTNSGMIGASVIYLEKNGTKLTVITSGTPTSAQVLFESSLGKFTFGTSLVNTDVVNVIYLL